MRIGARYRINGVGHITVWTIGLHVKCVDFGLLQLFQI